MGGSRPLGGDRGLAAHRGAAVGWFVLAGACAAEAPSPPGPAAAAVEVPLSGSVVYLSEASRTPTLMRADLATGHVDTLGGGLFPGATDPLGKLVVVVRSEETPAGHRETLCTIALGRVGGAGAEAEPCAPLAPPAEFVRNPAWAPDGAFVVFESSVVSFRDLWRVPRGGGAAERLTEAPHGCFDPAVSPDGGTLLFASSRDGDLELYRQPLAGGDAERLTSRAGEDRAPAWRPDGGRVAWLATVDGRSLVMTALPDGGDAVPLTPATEGAVAFSWSPDGRRLAVLAGGERGELRLVDAVRGLLLAHTPAAVANAPPAWSTDGARVFYAADGPSGSVIHAVDADGTHARAVTPGPGPEWLPRVVVAVPTQPTRGAPPGRDLAW
jgi:hypothetical protein